MVGRVERPNVTRRAVTPGQTVEPRRAVGSFEPSERRDVLCNLETAVVEPSKVVCQAARLDLGLETARVVVISRQDLLAERVGSVPCELVSLSSALLLTLCVVWGTHLAGVAWRAVDLAHRQSALGQLFDEFRQLGLDTLKHLETVGQGCLPACRASAQYIDWHSRLTLLGGCSTVKVNIRREMRIPCILPISPSFYRDIDLCGLHTSLCW